MVEQVKEKLYQGEIVFVMYEGPELFKMVPSGEGMYNRYRRMQSTHGSWLSHHLEDTKLSIDDVPVAHISIHDDEDEAISNFNSILQEQLEKKKREEKHFL